MTTIRVQNIPLSASIDDLLGHLTSDREGVASSSLQCSHDNPSRQVATITFAKEGGFKKALDKANTVLRTSSDPVRIAVDDRFLGFTVVVGGPRADVEYGCSIRSLSQTNDLQYYRISRTGWTRFQFMDNEAP
jgi:hypothetical protein